LEDLDSMKSRLETVCAENYFDDIKLIDSLFHEIAGIHLCIGCFIHKEFFTNYALKFLGYYEANDMVLIVLNSLL
jgi:hypothetical protein